jgi:TPR repeat protein
VTKDEAGAAAWFTRAAFAGNPLAQLRLARLYADGHGVNASPPEAARWFLIAKDQGLDDDYMDQWLGRLDAKTREDAQAAADRWSRIGTTYRTAASTTTPAPREPVDKQVE